MRAVSIYYEGMFSYSDYELPNEVLKKQDINCESEFHSNLKSAMGNNDLVCNTIIVRNQKYCNGDLIVVGIEDSDNLSVGLVKSILVKRCKVFFVIQRYTAVRHWLRYFICKKPEFDVFEFADSSKICDYKPLIMRGTVKQFVFTMHHHVSFDYM